MRSWTETPQQKLLRLSAAEQQRPAALEAAVPQSSAAAEAVDAYNDSHRAKTLVQKHQEKLKVGWRCCPDSMIPHIFYFCLRARRRAAGDAMHPWPMIDGCAEAAHTLRLLRYRPAECRRRRGRKRRGKQRRKQARLLAPVAMTAGRSRIPGGPLTGKRTSMQVPRWRTKTSL